MTAIILARIAARATKTLSLCSFEGVLGRVFVAVWAMGFCAIQLPCVASPLVDCPGYRFEMVRVNAAPNAAQVVQLHPFRDRPHVELVGDAVGVLETSGNAATSGPEPSISRASKRAEPEPATSFSHGDGEFQQPFLESHGATVYPENRLGESTVSTTLLAKLRTAAATDPVLGPLLGTSPFRWYDQQLVQGTAFPAVAAFVVSTIDQYVVNGLLISAQYRVQFNAFDPDPQVSRQVASAIRSFLVTFNAYNSLGNTGAMQPNRIVNRRDGGIAQTAPLTAMQIMDAMIWNNETL